MSAGIYRGQKMAPDPLELGLPAVNCLIWVLGTELGCPIKALSTLNSELLFQLWGEGVKVRVVSHSWRTLLPWDILRC